jgi:hypothetical protein
MSKNIISRIPSSASVYVGGSANVAMQFPLWGKGSVVRYWAERGLVHWEDSKDNTYSTMFWQDAAARVLGLSELVHNSREKGLYGDEIVKLQNFICAMEKVIRQAKEQGGPLDDVEQIAAERRRRSKKIVPLRIANDPLEFGPPARPARRDPYVKPVPSKRGHTKTPVAAKSKSKTARSKS